MNRLRKSGSSVARCLTEWIEAPLLSVHGIHSLGLPPLRKKNSGASGSHRSWEGIGLLWAFKAALAAARTSAALSRSEAAPRAMSGLNEQEFVMRRSFAIGLENNCNWDYVI